MKKIDYPKTFKNLYTAASRIKEVNAKKARFLCVDGKGEPGGKAFQNGIQGLFSVAYTVKFMLKGAKVVDFGVSRLEAFWPECDYAHTPQSEWRWRIAIRVPEQVTAAVIAHARKAIKARKGLDASLVKPVVIDEGRSLQVMHVGPYDKIGAAYGQLLAHAAENGLALAGAGHEIYLTDPRRGSPSKIKTIVRLPVKPAARRPVKRVARKPAKRTTPKPVKRAARKPVKRAAKKTAKRARR
jgi:hypothetical protein